jgi:DNA-binding NarL/FixJ family response regulator
MPIRLVLADDHPLILDALENLFHLEPDCEVVARCQDGEETVQAVRAHQPDLLLLDIRMPRLDGLAVLRELQPTQQSTRVVLSGVVLKDMAPQVLLQCVRKVYAGERWLERDLVGRALDKLLKREARTQELSKLLTPRELELVRMVVQGLRNKDIAKRLFISEGTVKIHLHHIYDKLQLDGRLALFRYMQDKELV